MQIFIPAVHLQNEVADCPLYKPVRNYKNKIKKIEIR